MQITGAIYVGDFQAIYHLQLVSRHELASAANACMIVWSVFIMLHTAQLKLS